MKHILFRPGHLWINFNIVLFIGYTIFGIPSFFLPTPLKNIVFILLHLATLLVDILVIYGLVVRIPRINYLIVLISTIMIMHLLISIFVPLGMALAYIAPSRAFYTLFILLVSALGGERFISSSLTAFNSLMVLIHVINIFYFTRKKVAALFRTLPDVR